MIPVRIYINRTLSIHPPPEPVQPKPSNPFCLVDKSSISFDSCISASCPHLVRSTFVV